MEKKLNCQGFSLLETLIVSIFIVGILLVLYTQYIYLQKSYDKTSHYNSVTTVYNTKQMANFLESKEASYVIQTIGGGNTGYADITDCQGVVNIEYCQALLSVLKVKTVLIMENNPSKLINEIKENKTYSETIYNFLRQIDINTDKNYRLVIEYQNGELGSLNLEIG